MLMLLKMGNTWFCSRHLKEWLSLVALLKEQEPCAGEAEFLLKACPTVLNSPFTTCGAAAPWGLSLCYKWTLWPLVCIQGKHKQGCMRILTTLN